MTGEYKPRRRKTDEQKERARQIRISRATGRRRAQRENTRKMLDGCLQGKEK